LCQKCSEANKTREIPLKQLIIPTHTFLRLIFSEIFEKTGRCLSPVCECNGYQFYEMKNNMHSYVFNHWDEEQNEWVHKNNNFGKPYWMSPHTIVQGEIEAEDFEKLLLTSS